MRILIATHGTLAQGLKSALSIIIGKVDKVDIINAYIDDKNLSQEIEAYFEKCQEELIVCTDLFGGSVNQAIIQKLKEKEFTLVTGIQLPLLLELVIAVNNNELDKVKLKSLVENSRRQTMVVNELLFENTEDDFD